MWVFQPLLHQHLLPITRNNVPIFPWPSSPSNNIHKNRNLLIIGQALPSKTQRIMESISVTEEVGGAGGAYSYAALKRLDNLWSNLCSTQTIAKETPKVVSSVPGLFSQSNISGKEVEAFDVLVCGGTLGIFIATALSCKGLRVGIVERNILKGREQEWNISRKELLELVEVGILEENDFEQAISATFNPNRCGFEGRGEIWVEEILNLGVSPVKLIEIMKKRFDSLGGVTFEGYSVSCICVYEDAAVLQLAEGKMLSGRLVIDAMGNFSPIVKQIRNARKPDGVCLVVGSCCRGFQNNSTSDVIFSSSAVKKVGKSQAQYFWEAFPAGSGPLDRTTYMFTYVDPQPECPKLEELLEDYWELMPKYQSPVCLSGGRIIVGALSPTCIAEEKEPRRIRQGIEEEDHQINQRQSKRCFQIRHFGVSLDNLQVLRVIYGIFPTYRDSPLPSAFDRVLQFGDASGIQSPVSFGGFGSLTRHLRRLSNGIYEAIRDDLLDSDNLSLLNPYMPNLSSSWLFQRAMSAKKQSNVSPEFINELLYANFQSMQRLGDPVLRPFLQDVIQFGPLVKTLGQVMVTKPQIIPSIFKQVGIQVLVDWLGHFLMLGYYTILSTVVDPAIRPLVDTFPTKMRYKWKRQLEAWKYGAGLDYEYKPSHLGRAQVQPEMSNEMDKLANS